MALNLYAISSGHVFKRMFSIPSGPIALWILIFFSIFKTPSKSIFNCGVVFVFQCLPNSGTISLESLLKTNTNCLMSTFALLLASVRRFHMDFRGAIPMLSFLFYLQ